MKWLVQPFARSYGPQIQTNIHLTNYMIRKSLDIKNIKHILTINFVNIIFQTVKTAEITYYFSHIKTHKIHTHTQEHTHTYKNSKIYIIPKSLIYLKRKVLFSKTNIANMFKIDNRYQRWLNHPTINRKFSQSKI